MGKEKLSNKLLVWIENIAKMLGLLWSMSRKCVRSRGTMYLRLMGLRFRNFRMLGCFRKVESIA